MGAFYTPNIPYDLNTYIDNLGAYSLSEESAKVLDLAREVINSQSYYFLGVPFPGVSDILVGAHDSFVGNATLPPLSYLMMLTGTSLYAGESAGRSKLAIAKEGFKLRIYDKGGKIDTTINTQFANSTTIVGVMDSTVQNRPMGPFLLPDPMVILAPGSVQLELTNLAPVSCYIQVLLQLAVPIGRGSTNEMIIKSVRG